MPLPSQPSINSHKALTDSQDTQHPSDAPPTLTIQPPPSDSPRNSPIFNKGPTHRLSLLQHAFVGPTPPNAITTLDHSTLTSNCWSHLPTLRTNPNRPQLWTTTQPLHVRISRTRFYLTWEVLLERWTHLNQREGSRSHFGWRIFILNNFSNLLCFYYIILSI